MDISEVYRIDGEKIDGAEDLATIIGAMDIRIDPGHPAFEELKPYLTEVEVDVNESYK